MGLIWSVTSAQKRFWPNKWAFSSLKINPPWKQFIARLYLDAFHTIRWDDLVILRSGEIHFLKNGGDRREQCLGAKSSTVFILLHIMLLVNLLFAKQHQKFRHFRSRTFVFLHSFPEKFPFTLFAFFRWRYFPSCFFLPTECSIRKCRVLINS